MEPIINPLYFYLCSIAGSLKSAGEIIAAIIACLLFGLLIFSPLIFMELDDFDSPIRKFLSKLIKISIPAIIISVFIYILTPSQEACYQMLIASAVTKDNINYTQDKITDLVDYIIDKVDTTLNKEETD